MNDPLEPDEPSALVQFAIVLAFAAFFALLLFGYCH